MMQSTSDTSMLVRIMQCVVRTSTDTSTDDFRLIFCVWSDFLFKGITCGNV
jgi:hypothetical protein